MIQTKYVGATDASRNPDASSSETAGEERAFRKRYAAKVTIESSTAWNRRKPFVPNARTNGEAISG